MEGKVTLLEDPNTQLQNADVEEYSVYYGRRSRQLYHCSYGVSCSPKVSSISEAQLFPANRIQHSSNFSFELAFAMSVYYSNDSTCTLNIDSLKFEHCKV